MNQIYALEDRGEIVRVYGRLKGQIKGKLAEYFIYVDNKEMEWLHIHVIKEDLYYLFPFNSKLQNHFEYLKWLDNK